MTRRYLTLAAAAGCALGAFAADFSSGWQVMPVDVNGATDLTKCLPESGEWTDRAFSGGIPQAKNAKKGNLQTGEYNAWYRKTLAAPAAWKGRSVRLEFGLNMVDAVVFVNGKEAGKAFHPDGAVELAPFLKYGQDNEIKVFVGNCGFGTNEKIVYMGRDEMGNHFGQLGFNIWGVKRDALHLEVRAANWVETAWVEPSWRKKQLEVFATVHSLEGGSADFSAVVTEDADGRRVKDGRASVKLRRGETQVKLVIPWDDPVTWETVKNPHLYRCKVALAGGDAPDAFIFGFREIWREGKEIMMNGHVQRFRGFWSQGWPKNLSDLHDYGYNLAYETHQHLGVFAEDQEQCERFSRAGVCRFKGMPSIYSLHGWTFIHRDELCRRQWERQLNFWMKGVRNWPCIAAASCGVNQMCPSDNMIPGILAERLSGGVPDIVKDINLACTTARKLHPNCLYFSHADGTEAEADISSSNLYFNFTPLQEREEWLASWAQNGIRPWYAAEFGAPYYACWFHSRVPEPTEWLAAYYGERAYAEEKLELLANLRDFARDCRHKTHGGWVKGGDLYAFSPLMEEYSRMLVYRTNRAWRGFGQNGGLMYLTSWPWDTPNAMRERQRLANGPLVTFLGGAPEFTDRTHAYWTGEKIAKNLVFCWDGPTDLRATAAWRFVGADGKPITSGTVEHVLKPGEILLEPIEVTAPAAKDVASCRLEVSFDAPGIDDSVRTDCFPLEVYPKFEPLAAKTFRDAVVGFCDPDGATKAWMTACGVTGADYPDVETALREKKLTHLVIGRRALDRFCGLEKAAARMAEGLAVWIGPQTAETWEAMGFKVEDAMPRKMYDVSLGVADAALEHWRGFPAWERQVGNVMAHKTRRGPRWSHRHALGGLAMLIPNKAGFAPLVRGEFDMSYSMLLAGEYGRGGAVFCSLDFEGRVGEGTCPAASRAAGAALGRFFAPRGEVVVRRPYAAGAAAERLLAKLGADYEKWSGGKVKDAVVVAGGDADATTLEKALGRGTTLYVFGNTNYAAAAGLAVTPGSVQKADLASVRALPPFARVGGSLLRWREPLNVGLVSGGRGWKTAAGGLFAVRGDEVVVDAVNPFQLCDRYRKTADAKAIETKAAGGWGIQPQSEADLLLRSAAQTEENDLRRVALILGNLGVKAGAKVAARALYADPCPGGTDANMVHIGRFNVLGPWPCGKENPEKTLDTIFRVEEGVMGDTGEKAEQMAREGDVQPNPRFHPIGAPYKAGLPNDLRFIDWRPSWQQQQTGVMCIDWMNAPASFVTPCAWYAVGYLPRKMDGTVSVRFKAAGAGKVWINGKEVCRSVGNSPAAAEGVPVYANGHKGDGVFEGVNVVAVKIVTTQPPLLYNLLVSRELSPAAKMRVRVPELDPVPLYETANPQFDPYEYIYW